MPVELHLLYAKRCWKQNARPNKSIGVYCITDVPATDKPLQVIFPLSLCRVVPFHHIVS